MKKLLIIIAMVLLVLGIQLRGVGLDLRARSRRYRLANLYLYRRPRGVYRHGRVCGE